MLTKKEQRLRRSRQTRIRIATQGVARLTVNLQIKEGWGPNVYVSVLALRGRLREVPRRRAPRR